MTHIDRPLEADLSPSHPTEGQKRALDALAELRDAMRQLVRSNVELLGGVDPHLTAIRRMVLNAGSAAR